MRLMCVLAALCLSSLTAFSQTATFEWRGEIQPGQSLEIRNINGSIRAERAEGSETEISVRITGTRPAPESIRIHIEPHAGGVLACTIYEGLSLPNYCTPEIDPSVNLSNSDIRVFYTVRVPAGVTLVAKTVNGSINADLPESSITAATVNGRIWLTTGQAASANTVNGSIIASLASVEGTEKRAFHTVTGTIDLEVPAAVQASVRASTLVGPITTDFPLRVTRGFIGTGMKGDINGGGPMLTMETVTGGAHLRKSDSQQ